MKDKDCQKNTNWGNLLLVDCLARDVERSSLVRRKLHRYETWTYIKEEYQRRDVVLRLVAQSCPTLCDSMDCSPPFPNIHGGSPGKDTGVGCHFLLQGIFPTQEPNPCLLHCRWILYHWATWEALIFNYPRANWFENWANLREWGLLGKQITPMFPLPW